MNSLRSKLTCLTAIAWLALAGGVAAADPLPYELQQVSPEKQEIYRGILGQASQEELEEIAFCALLARSSYREKLRAEEERHEELQFSRQQMVHHFRAEAVSRRLELEQEQLVLSPAAKPGSAFRARAQWCLVICLLAWIAYEILTRWPSDFGRLDLVERARSTVLTATSGSGAFGALQALRARLGRQTTVPVLVLDVDSYGDNFDFKKSMESLSHDFEQAHRRSLHLRHGM